MATNVELQKWLTGITRSHRYDGHLLHRRPVKGTHVFCWAAVDGELAITEKVQEARSLWMFKFRLAAREEVCVTSFDVLPPERYSLCRDGKKAARCGPTLEITTGDRYSERLRYEIVDEQGTYEGNARYRIDGKTTVGAQTEPFSGTMDLV